MARRLTLAALVLALGLTAAGCGSTADAGASARRWAGEDSAIQYQNEARGPLSGGQYTADGSGRVAGFRRDGTEALRGAKDAAKNVSDMAEEAIDDAVDSARR